MSTDTSAGPASMSGDPTTSDDTDAGSTGYEPMPCGNEQGICLSVPMGWSGPVAAAVAVGGADATCSTGEADVFARGAIDGAGADCQCECDAATGAECTDGRLVAWGGDNTCSASEVFSQVIYPDTGSGDPCNFMPSGETTGEVPVEGASYWTLTTESRGGSCAAQATENIPTASYQTSVAGCAVAELTEGDCTGGASCYVEPLAPYEPGACVWRLGSHECPGGDFSARTLWYRGALEDTRACSGCSCGEAAGSCPDSVADLFVGYYCNGAAVQVGDACVEHCFEDAATCNTYAISALFFPGTAEASCTPIGGELTGDLTGTDPVTFCCTG
jgi:hypothetical protein